MVVIRHRALRMALSLLWLIATIAAVTNCQRGNFDTDQPILRKVEGLEIRSYFGYSLVLHQTNGNPTNMADSLNGARIIVSAPNGTAPGASVPNTGLVYSCPVNPGQCSPLSGKLFDTTANENNENKANQFLGASMYSNGEGFIVCAHRYTYVSNPYGFQGKCFYSNGRVLENFQEYQCSDLRCQAGTSSIIVTDEADSNIFGIGAPGYRSWRGALLRLDGTSRTTNTRRTFNRDSYQGYTITAGRLLTSSRQDFAVSLPRGRSNNYFGSVNLIMNTNSLAVVSQPLRGIQMGEYYGFSLLTADLNGDNYDELLISAPLYRANSTEPDTGRVYLYRNNGGSLQLLRTIEGRTRYSRFGYAMANIGDINGDGFDDVAISAPFAETGSVFIYHSSPVTFLTTEPQQIIQGSDLRLSQSLSELRGFGTSLASGVDVDMNGYNDLLIGSFVSEKVFLLRTRPFAQIQTSISANPLIVDVGKLECQFSSVSYACFNLTTCATYHGRGVSHSLALNFSITGDTQSLEQRIIFENNRASIIKSISATNNTQACTTFKAYIRNNTVDRFNPFIIEVGVTSPQREVTTGNGNETLEDLSGFPVVTVTGTTQVQVETLKECGGGECIPDLRISVTETIITTKDRQNTSSSKLTAGFASSVDLFLTVENSGEDAFQSILSFVLPTDILELVNIFNLTSNGEVSLRCSFESLGGNTNQPLAMTRYNCSIGNPFSGPGMIELRVNLEPSDLIIGNENNASIDFTVSSINPENTTTIEDNSNFATTQLEFEAKANITIDNGVVTPEQISYSDNPVLKTEIDDVSNVTFEQLGPAVDVSFLVRNSGPSNIPNAQLDISWPLNSSLTGKHYYLYITSIQSSGAATVTCDGRYINPLSLIGDVGGDQEGGTMSMGSGRRKRRSTIKRTLRKKRQEDVSPDEQNSSENRTLNCMSPGQILNCINIRCNILGLVGSRSVQIDINSRLDERYFSLNTDRYTFTPTAMISIPDGDFFISNAGSSMRSATAQIRVIPAARVVIIGEATPVPWWAIFVPILAAVIIITVVTVLLWVFGFFRRKKHEEIKQKREELKNLTAHGVSPDDNVLEGTG